MSCPTPGNAPSTIVPRGAPPGPVPTQAKARALGVTLSVLCLSLLLVGCGPNGSSEHEQPAVVVFAAASLREVVQAIGARFAEAHQVNLVYNFAGSNTLAQQLRAAPVADVFLSANPDWVEMLDRAGLVLPASRRNFVSNRLVLISRKDAEFHLPAPGLLPALPLSFLALANPEAVPAGRYAKTFLQAVETTDRSVWEAVKYIIVPTADVRAALGLVESDPTIMGIVYRTDALHSDQVQVVYEVPPGLHPPVVYCAVALKARPRPTLTAQFLDFLHSPEAVAIYTTHGFIVDEEETQPRSSLP